MMTGRFFAIETVQPTCGIHGTKKGRCRCREKLVRWTLVSQEAAYPVVNPQLGLTPISRRELFLPSGP